MACNEKATVNNTCSRGNNTGFLIIVVLYILLAIILSSCIW